MSGPADNVPKRAYLSWGLAGIGLVSPLFFISVISPKFDYELADIHKPIIILVAMMIAAGAIYLYVILRFKDLPSGRGWWIWVVLIGLLARLSMFGSTPALEDDHYRYLWDGAVLANGFSPYKYSPRDVLIEQTSHIPVDLRQLAREAGPIPRRINYPYLRTIYPPVAEGAFALAHIIDPWSIDAWRTVLLAVDLLTLYLLFIALRTLNLSSMGLVVYWWNPLLIKELYNSCHMDVIIFPFIVGALLLSIRCRYVLASGALGIAVGTKFWPIVLVPVVLRPVVRDPKRLASAVAVFGCLSLAMFLPLYLTGLDFGSGFRAYGSQREMNDALFMVFLWPVEFIIRAFSLDVGYAQLATRGLVSGLLLAWTFWLIRRHDEAPLEIARRFLFVIAALFLLSPTQFPWYYLWMLPFLAIHPRVSLLLLTVLLPLYYMRFYVAARGMVAVHDSGIVWLEFVPVWCLLIWEWYKGRTPSVSTKGEAF